MAKQPDLLQGTLDLLILKAVSLEPVHGYGILLRIEQLSGGRLQIQQGSSIPPSIALKPAAGSNPNGAKARTIAAPNTTSSPLWAAASCKQKLKPGAA